MKLIINRIKQASRTEVLLAFIIIVLAGITTINQKKINYQEDVINIYDSKADMLDSLINVVYIREATLNLYIDFFDYKIDDGIDSTTLLMAIESEFLCFSGA